MANVKSMAQAIRNYTPPPEQGRVEQANARTERGREPRNQRAQMQIAKNVRPPPATKGPGAPKLKKIGD